MTTLKSRIIAALILMAALAGCAGTGGVAEDAMTWMQQQDDLNARGGE